MSESDIEFQEFELPLADRWFQASQVAVRDMNLTSDAYRLLCYLSSNSKNWENYAKYIRKIFKWGEARLTSAIRCLHNCNYIKRERIKRDDGKLGHYKYQYCQKPVFKNEVWEEPKARDRSKTSKLPNVDESSSKPTQLPVEGLQPHHDKPGLVKPRVANPDLPMPKEPMPKLTKAMKALPSSISSSQALEASPSKKPIGKQDPEVLGRRHKRPEAQEETFQWLLGLSLLNDNQPKTLETLSVLTYTYTRKKLEDTYFHLIHKLNAKGVKVKKSAMAFYRYLLENEHDCRGTNSELNEAFARNFAKELGWGSLEFKEKYVVDRNNSAKDISFNMEPSAFRDSLGGLYMSVNANYGT